MLRWLANRNFFNRPTFIRKVQCDVFGHEWFCFDKKNEWCAWCARKTGPYPKMRERKQSGRDRSG